uniref:Uncharacterized protein n=1 Tax=Amphilophus citrinellus TaxID=61819 RepID=A0A3Q0RZQ9_AMPCI
RALSNTHDLPQCCNSLFSAGIKPGAANSGATGPTSQIPGLCQTATESAPAERISGRRVGIFESDSDYVKLAKQGGHKGKIRHLNKPYNPPNWFGGDESKSQTKGGRQPLAPPFGTDNDSPWEREPDSFSHGKEKVNGFQKYITPPMSKLLSHGYVEGQKSPNDDDASSMTLNSSRVLTSDV